MSTHLTRRLHGNRDLTSSYAQIWYRDFSFCMLLRSGIKSRDDGIENVVLHSVHLPRVLDEALTWTETELQLTVDD